MYLIKVDKIDSGKENVIVEGFNAWIDLTEDEKNAFKTVSDYHQTYWK